MHSFVAIDFTELFGPVLASAQRLPQKTRSIAADSIDDSELVFRMRHNDRWAEEAFYRRHVDGLMAMVVRLLGHKQDAEEVVQDTFLAALEELPRLRDPSAARSWLRMIAVRKVHRRFRKRKLLRALGLDRAGDEVTLASLVASSAPTDTRTELAMVDRMLSSVSVESRTAWMLRHVDGEQLEDVARICNCSLATVKRRIAQCDSLLANEFVAPAVEDVYA